MIDAENMNEENAQVSLEKSSRPWIILSLLISLILIGLLSLISDSWRDNRSIEYVKVYGCNLASVDEISDLIYDSVAHKYIKDIDISEISSIIKSNSFVEEVRLNPLFNGEFQVFITERKPIAITVNSNNELVYVDRNGFAFPYVNKPDIYDYPVIRGFIGTESFVHAAILLNRIITECPEHLEIISEIMPGRGHNTYEIISSDFAYRIIIDGRTNIAEQLSKYYTFLASSICANDKIKIDYLDLRWEKRLVIGKLS